MPEEPDGIVGGNRVEHAGFPVVGKVLFKHLAAQSEAGFEALFRPMARLLGV